jgi:hypothetical protein
MHVEAGAVAATVDRNLRGDELVAVAGIATVEHRIQLCVATQPQPRTGTGYEEEAIQFVTRGNFVVDTGRGLVVFIEGVARRQGRWGHIQ